MVAAEVTSTMLGGGTDSPDSVRDCAPATHNYSDGMSVRRVLLGLVAGVSLLTGACTGPPASDRGAAGPSPGWRAVALPQGLSAVTLAVAGDDVLVGARGPDRPHPRLLTGVDATALHEVPLTPRSPYAFEATWFQLAVRDGRIEAVGGARGGAHGNYRWTTWSGDLSGVAELEQPFGVFGSYGAGDLVGVAHAGRSPVVLGAWQSERTGMDIATWTRSGERWSRRPSTGTPLGSTPEALVGARAIAADGQGLILSGSVTRLTPGRVRVDPAVWRSPDADGPWTRTDLPRPDDTSSTEAHAATCRPDGCLVAGSTGGRLALWEVQEGTPRRVDGIPAVTLPDRGTALAPLIVRDDVLVVAPSGGGSTLLRRVGDAWAAAPGPPGTPVSAVVHGGELWVVTTSPGEPGALHRARVA